MGCSNNTADTSARTPEKIEVDIETNDNTQSSDASDADDAKSVKVINCEYACHDNMDDVSAAWDDPDTDDFVSDAKGTYATYDEKGVVFGYNSGNEIFEVRRVSGDVLEKIELKDIKNVLGDPDYTSTGENKNPIVGYQVSDDYKLILVLADAGDESGV